MKLKEYLESLGWGSRNAFAEQTGLHAQSISNWCTGKRPIPPTAAVIIEQATNGDVTRPEMLPEKWSKLWPELLKQYNPDGTRKHK